MSKDLKTELMDKINELNTLESEIFSGNQIEIFMDDEIADICQDFDNDYYETGPIRRNIYNYNLPELIKIAKPSNFGLGTETKYDPNVRNSLEVMASELDPGFVNTIKNEIKIKKLATNYELKPYKLVIYEKGAFFKSHKDTIRDPKHIGTVSCILNSSFYGGEFIVNHNGKKEQFSGTNEWIAIYGDVFHEVAPVIHGTRVSLLFDIYLTDAIAGNTDAIDILRQNLDKKQNDTLIQKITSKFNNYDTVVIGMFHEYSQAQLDAKDLKNADRCIYEIINKKFNVSLDVLKYKEKRYGDENQNGCILDTSDKFNHCYVSFNSEIYDTSSLFTRGEPYTGNDGGSSENLYVWAGFVITQRVESAVG